MATLRRKKVAGRVRATRKNARTQVEKTVVDEVVPVAESTSDKPLANVGLSVAFTKNLGDYESLKVDVSLHLPCDWESVDEAFAAVEEWVLEKLDATVALICEQAD